jgi:uncharacterized protein (DUF1499 family)
VSGTTVTVAAILLLAAGTACGAVDGTLKGAAMPPQNLRPCPASPNCVSTESSDPGHRLDPIPFSGSPEAARERLRAVIATIPRAAVTVDEPGRLAVSFRSRVFGFVDEAEFVIDGEKRVILFRSGARTGWYDFGVNRSRMKRIALDFANGISPSR